MAFKTFQKESRERYGRDFCGDKSQWANGEELKKGALLRIADALELMIKDKRELEKEVSKLRVYENAVREITDENNDLKRRNLWHAHSNSALRGVIARMKKQAKKA